MHVKVLFSSGHSSLQEELQQWLDEMAERITITGLSLSSNEYGHCLVISYSKETGPGYTGWVWFSRSHTALENDANTDMAEVGADGKGFMAVGSNKLGHCLCVIAPQ